MPFLLFLFGAGGPSPAEPLARARVEVGRVECVRARGDRAEYRAQARVVEEFRGHLAPTLDVHFFVTTGRTGPDLREGEEAVLNLRKDGDHYVLRNAGDATALRAPASARPVCRP